MYKLHEYRGAVKNFDGSRIKDESIIQAFKNPNVPEEVDIYSYIASKVFGFDYDEFIGALDDVALPTTKNPYRILRTIVKANMISVVRNNQYDGTIVSSIWSVI